MPGLACQTESQCGWRRLGGVLLAAAVCAAGLTYLFLPGLMSFDSVDQYRQALGRVPVTDQHPAIMTFLWRGLMRIHAAPGMMLVFHQALYWAALVLFALNVTRSTRWRLACVLGIGLWPPLLAHSVVVWKDVGMVAGFMLAVAGILADRRRPHLGWLVLAALGLFYATEVRHNGITAALPIMIVLAYRVALRLGLGRLRRAAATLAVVLCLGGAQYGLSKAVNAGVAHFNSLATLLVWDMAAIAVHEERADLLPRYVCPGGCPDLAELRAAFNPNVNVPVLRIVGYGGDANGQLVKDWLALVADHPRAYLRHRAHVFKVLLSWRTGAVYYGFQGGIIENDLGLKLVNMPERLKWTKLFKLFTQLPVYWPWPYLLLSFGLIVWSGLSVIRRRSLDGDDAMVLMLSTSAVGITLPLFVAAPSADYRYVLWMVGACVMAVAVAAPRLAPRIVRRVVKQEG